MIGLRTLVLAVSLAAPIILSRPAAADDVPLVADLSNYLVAITAGFTGADVLLFGATDGPGDIVAVVRGPIKDLVVRRKDRLGPIWVNADSLTLRDVPSYYRVASTRPLAEFAPQALLSRYQIGLDNLRLAPAKDTANPDQVKQFQQALIRLKTAAGLYSEQLDSVNTMSNRLFRTDLHFPANVPTGTYLVEVYLFRDGQVTSAEIVPFIVSKIGVGADIYDFAAGHGIIYGLVAIVIAVSAGYAAGVAFRQI